MQQSDGWVALGIMGAFVAVTLLVALDVIPIWCLNVYLTLSLGWRGLRGLGQLGKTDAPRVLRFWLPAFLAQVIVGFAIARIAR